MQTTYVVFANLGVQDICLTFACEGGYSDCNKSL